MNNCALRMGCFRECLTAKNNRDYVSNIRLSAAIFPSNIYFYVTIH